MTRNTIIYVRLGDAGPPAPWDLEALRQEYERTRDPSYAWLAYGHCRIECATRGQRPELPDWVWLYFDQVGAALVRSDGATDLTKRKDLTKRFARALAPGFEPRGHRLSRSEQREKASRDVRLALLAQEEIERGNSQAEAWAIVAEAEGGISDVTVRNTWRTYIRVMK
jgi:hypothetical protein